MNWPIRLMALSAALATPGLSAQTYKMVDLGTFSQGVATVVRGPNGTGIASGSGNPAGTRRDGFGGRRGLVLEAGATPSLVTGLAGSDDATVFAVNDAGAFVGSSNTAVAARAFTGSRKGAVSELPPLPGDVASAAYGLNNIGQAVGFSSGASGERAVLWSARGAPEHLPTPGTPEASRAHAINERGDVVGSVSAGGGRRPVVWRSGQTASDLPLLGGFSTGEVYAVNARGTAVGYSSNAAASRRATRWSATGAPSELGNLPGGNFSEAFGINDAGDVVGTSTSPGGGTRAVLWTGAGERVDLNTLVEAPTVVLTKATGINNRGMIVVVGHEPPAHSPAAKAPSHDHADTHDLPVRVFLLTRVGGPQ